MAHHAPDHAHAAHDAGHDAGHHVPGTMDIRRQEATFDAFMRFATRTVIVIVVLLVFLALVNG